MAYAALGVALMIYGVRELRTNWGRSFELSLAAFGLQLAGVVVLLSA